MTGLKFCAILLILAPIILPSQVNYRLPAISCNRTNQDQAAEFNSVEDGFSVKFPKKPTASFSAMKVENTVVRVVTHSVRDGSTYEVSYFDLPHAQDDPKVTGNVLIGLCNYVVAKLKGTLDSEAPLWLDNNEARMLEISIAKRGTARAIVVVTATRLYRITVVPENNSNEAATSAAAFSFFRSFKLLPIERTAEGEVEAYLRQNPELAKRAFVVDQDGAFINGRALAVPIPDYPAPARMARATGTVVVNIVIDEEGKVIAAQAITGHSSLRLSAVQAARGARFTPTVEQGRRIKVLGQVQYNFVRR